MKAFAGQALIPKTIQCPVSLVPPFGDRREQKSNRPATNRSAMIVDFGPARHIGAVALGAPGSRVFQLMVMSESGELAALKLEKEQVVGLRLALAELLRQAGDVSESGGGDGEQTDAAPGYEFPVGSLGIGFSAGDETVAIEAQQLAQEGEPAEGVRFRLTLPQAASLAAQLHEIIAASRPICPMCRTPIDPSGHFCIRSNGHSQESIPEEPA